MVRRAEHRYIQVKVTESAITGFQAFKVYRTISQVNTRGELVEETSGDIEGST